MAHFAQLDENNLVTQVIAAGGAGGSGVVIIKYAI